MAQGGPPPAKALVLVVMGSTGAGKTQLGTELALRVNGEVINADAMQVYDELPIATNRATQEEMCGVPHHLLACVRPLADPPFSVLDFRERADKLIADIVSRGRVPIVVGGTHYYIFSLLWRSLLLDSATDASGIGDDDDDVDDRVTEGEQDASQSNQELHAQLAAVDASMAAKLHVNDRRKVLRSLQVYRFFGRAHSALLAEQRAAPADMLRYRALLFNLWAQEEPLGKRLDGRVDAMLERGLRAELLAFRQRIRDDAQRADTTHGVFQAIGYKEFMPLFDAIERRVEDVGAIEEQCIAQLKRQTRVYAAKQQAWVRNKIAPAVRRVNAPELVALMSLDTSDASRFRETVVEPAAAAAAEALQGRPPRLAVSGAPLDEDSEVDERPAEPWTKRRCDDCGKTVNGPKEWTEHIQSRQHRHYRARMRRKRNSRLDDAASQAHAAADAHSPLDQA